uniref:Uncharacterized protein n=1 Tax=Meloidogyne floridensis TaxID=298350 RepID=A0A915P993_9BILA
MKKVKPNLELSFIFRFFLRASHEINICVSIRYKERLTKYAQKKINSIGVTNLSIECFYLFRNGQFHGLIDSRLEELRETLFNFKMLMAFEISSDHISSDIFERLQKRPMRLVYKIFIKENLANDKNVELIEQFYDRLLLIFGHSRLIILREDYPALFGITDSEDRALILTKLFEHSLITDIIYKWRSRNVLDFILYKDWLDKFVKENSKNEIIEQFWNKIFKNYWFGVKLLLEYIEDSNDPSEEEIDEEITLTEFFIANEANNDKLTDLKDEIVEIIKDNDPILPLIIKKKTAKKIKKISERIFNAFHGHEEILKFFDDLNSTNDREEKNIFDSNLDEFFELISTEKIKLLDNIKFNDKKQIYLYGTGHQLNNDFSKFLTNIFGKFDDEKIFLNIERTLIYSWHIYKIVFIIISELAKNVKNFETIEGLPLDISYPCHLGSKKSCAVGEDGIAAGSSWISGYQGDQKL